MKNYIGIDNGISGSVGIILKDGRVHCFKTPVMKQQDYTKKKKIVTRLDFEELRKELVYCPLVNTLVLIERPFVNPGMFNATLSAVRAHESLLCLLEHLGHSYMFIDSKEWQKELLPAGVKGAKDLKKASLDIGSRLFPQQKEYFDGDADGILIAEFARRRNL